MNDNNNNNNNNDDDKYTKVWLSWLDNKTPVVGCIGIWFPEARWMILGMYFINCSHPRNPWPMASVLILTIECSLDRNVRKHFIERMFNSWQTPVLSMLIWLLCTLFLFAKFFLFDLIFILISYFALLDVYIPECESSAAGSIRNMFICLLEKSVSVFI